MATTEELKTPSSIAFVDAIHKKFGADVPYISELAAATYEGFYLWAEGVKQGREHRSHGGDQGAGDRPELRRSLRQGHHRPRRPTT